MYMQIKLKESILKQQVSRPFYFKERYNLNFELAYIVVKIQNKKLKIFTEHRI